MSTTKEKKSEKERLKEKIALRRTENGFLPTYSDFYFEKKKHNGEIWISVLIYLALITFVPAMIDGFENNPLTILGCFIVAILLYYIFFRNHFLNKKKLCGSRLTKEGIIKCTAFRQKPPVSYLYIEEAVATGNYEYDDTGLRIGKGDGELVFHYEIGDTEATKHVEECYQLLQQHMQQKLPPLNKKLLGLLDHKYYYEKMRKNQFSRLLGGTLLFLILYLSTVSSLAGAVILGVLISLWDCRSIYLLCQSAKLYAVNQAAIQLALKDFPQAKTGWKYTGYIYYIVGTVLVVLANFWIIMTF